MDNTTQGELIRGERLRAVGELTNDVAHDFNNLLAAILGRVELLLMRHDLAVDVRQELQLIQQATLDGAETVRRLWEPSRPRADRPIARIPGIRHGRLLVVDDNDVVRQSLSQILRMSGHEVTPAADGAEALHLMSLLPFDIVLTDLGMPAINGFELADRIHRDWPGMPIILVTGWGGEIDREQLDQHEVTAIVTKPFRAGEIDDVVQEVLTRAAGGIVAARREPNPAASDLASREDSAAPRSSATIEAPTTSRVLVVDDDVALCTMLRLLLHEANIDQTIVSTLEEAIAAMSDQPFDIVLTDLNLGLVQGWDVAAYIRRHWPGTVVGLMTGGATQVDRDAIERHQIDFILAKPFRRADFLATIANGMAIAARRRLSTTIRS